MVKEMNISQSGIDLIKRFEGFRPSRYLCPAGYETIGYGHVVRIGEQFNEPLTEIEAEELLRRDLEQFEQAVHDLVIVDLAQNQYDALVSFTFNVGPDAFRKSTLLRRVNDRDHKAAPKEFEKWVFVNGKRLKGLEKRRAAEAALYRGEIT